MFLSAVLKNVVVVIIFPSSDSSCRRQTYFLLLGGFKSTVVLPFLNQVFQIITKHCCSRGCFNFSTPSRKEWCCTCINRTACTAMLPQFAYSQYSLRLSPRWWIHQLSRNPRNTQHWTVNSRKVVRSPSDPVAARPESSRDSVKVKIDWKK